MTATTDALSNKTTFAFDANGNETAVTDANGHVTTYAFNSMNEITAMTDALSNRTTYAFDAAGNETAVTDANSHVTSYSFDALNRMTAMTDALSNKTTYAFDAVGNETAVTDASNNVTTFAFNAVNEETSTTNPNGYSATFAFDPVGNMTSTTDFDGRIRNISYDALNRETGETWTVNGSTVNTLTFAYDAVSNLTVAANNNGTYTMSYDALNQVTSVSEPFSVTMTFAYDSVGNRTVVQDSFSGTTTSVYNADNLLSTRKFSDGTSNLRIDLGYTGTNQLKTLTRYSDLAGTNKVATTTYLYDNADRVTSIASQDANSNSLNSFTYSYDAGSRLTSETDNGVTTTYSYDNGNELTSDATHSYTFDNTGNRTNTGYTTTTGNEMTSDGTWNYTYDHAGNVTQKTKISDGSYWKYSYDNLNHLTEADQHNSSNLLQQSVVFKYDAFGNRIEKDVTVGSTTTTQRYALDGWAPAKAGSAGNSAWDVWADLDGSNHLTARYFRGDVVDQLFAQIPSGTAYWDLTDRLGSIRTVIDNSATVKDQITYDGWGNATQTHSAYGGRFLYTGREHDSETGLEDNRDRYVDLTTSRFISQDPLGLLPDTNPYRYVYNAPESYTDPSGLLGPRPEQSYPGIHPSLIGPMGEWRGREPDPRERPPNLRPHTFTLPPSFGVWHPGAHDMPPPEIGAPGVLSPELRLYLDNERRIREWRERFEAIRRVTAPGRLQP
jgi:RHS repeat-associated protein